MTTPTHDIDPSVSTRPADPISAPMVAALEHAWTVVRSRHPELPAVVIVLGAGSIGRSLRYGHFAALRWQHTHHPDRRTGRLPEVLIGGEGLARGPVAVLGTVLHEAAHALAHARGIRDTSRQGRWHNTRFKTLAEELGITVTHDRSTGWSQTAVPTATRDRYTEVIAPLAAALRLYRFSETPSGTATKKTPPACACECGRRIRVAPTVLAAGPITCGICDTNFEPEKD